LDKPGLRQVVQMAEQAQAAEPPVHDAESEPHEE
jgi:hypothetical protein